MIVRISDLIDQVVVLAVDREAAEIFGELDHQLARAGRPVPFTDLLIASVLLRHGEARVVTRNARDFERIPGIEVVNY
jgi:predicted nucleic acid-binding protein